MSLKNPQTPKEHRERLTLLLDFKERLRQRRLGADEERREECDFLLERCQIEIDKERKFLGLATIEE